MVPNRATHHVYICIFTNSIQTDFTYEINHNNYFIKHRVPSSGKTMRGGEVTIFAKSLQPIATSLSLGSFFRLLSCFHICYIFPQNVYIASEMSALISYSKETNYLVSLIIYTSISRGTIGKAYHRLNCFIVRFVMSVFHIKVFERMREKSLIFFVSFAWYTENCPM